MGKRVHPLVALAANLLFPQKEKEESTEYQEGELEGLACIQYLKTRDGSVTLVLGKRESGKTIAAYRLAEILGLPIYVISPEQHPPSGVTELRIEDLSSQPPPFTTLILDDIPTYASQRDYNTPAVRALERLIPVVRHRRKIHLIFVAQSSSLSDKYTLTADLVLLKPPSLLFLDTERAQVAKVYKTVVSLFDKMSPDQRKRYVYILSDDWRGLAYVHLPRLHP